LSAIDTADPAGEERHLIQAAQQDPVHFAALYERNFDRVYAFLARRVATREEAEDLTAEVFHQAIAGLNRFEWQGTPFIAWLLGIAAKLLAKRWQRATRQPEVSADDLDLAGDPGPLDRQALLAELIALLPEDQRRVILSRFVEQRSLREIAQDLGRSEGAIKQLQFRALEKLRQHAKEKHHHE
jgi:RNA polymerase sigma-70 factor (ECF subfamily)